MNRISLWPADACLAICATGAALFLGLRGYDYYFFNRANDLLRS